MTRQKVTDQGRHNTGPLSTIGSPKFAEIADGTAIRSQSDIEGALAVLQSKKNDWVGLGPEERVNILNEILEDMVSVVDRWVTAGLDAKGIPAQTLGEAEEWACLALVFRALRTIRQAMIEIQKYGQPRISGPITTRPNGQVVAHVFPQNRMDRILFRGITGQVWMEPDITVEEAIKTQARVYQDKSHRGKVALVLGAGNASFLPLIDTLQKLFVEDQVVVLKPNPVNAYLGPLIEEGFGALIQRGFLSIVYGGSAEGTYLCNHPAVDELHITGSDKTFEAITFGTGLEGERRKAAHNPLNTKRLTGELGNVSPVIIVPGPWEKDDIEEQAVQLATWLVANAGFGCLTPRVIVQHKSWLHRNELLEKIGQALAKVDTRMAYYPGSLERHGAFVAVHPDARQYGRPSSGHLPWTLIADLDPEKPDEICFTRESFCSVYAETAIKASSTPEFIDRAVEFANKKLWGSLAATLIIHPKSLKDPLVSTAIDRAVAQLRYGTVALNVFVFYSAYFLVAPWGAFPGHDIYDIQSDIGKTFNFLMFERPEKSVIQAPFKKTDPLTVVSKRAHEFGKRLAYFEASPSWWRLVGLIWTALRG